MSKIDISGMTRAELLALIKSAQIAARKQAEKPKPDVRAYAARVLAEAKAAGIAKWVLIKAMQERDPLTPSGRFRSRPTALPGYIRGVKYTDPKTGSVWVGGIGWQPDWLVRTIQAGASFQSLAGPTPTSEPAQIRDALASHE